MANTNNEIIDLDISNASLVGHPSNNENFLSIQKEAGDPAACPIGRAIQHLNSMIGPSGDQAMTGEDHQNLIKVLEYLKTLDADHCADIQPAENQSQTMTPSMVRESLETLLINSTPEFQESLRPEFWRVLDNIKDLDESPKLITNPKSEKFRVLRESARFITSVDQGGWEWDVCIIEAGDSKNGSWDGGTFIPRYYPLETLENNTHLFEGAKVYVYEFKDDRSRRYDHLTEQALEANPNGYAKNLVGWISRPRMDGNSLMGTIRLLKGADWLRVNLQDSVKNGRPDLYGLSIDSDGSQHLGRVGGKPRLVVDALHDVRSVDVVTYPAAGGRFLRLVASRTIREKSIMPNELEQKFARFEERQALTSILRESRLPMLQQMKIRKRFIEAESIDFDRLELAIREAEMEVGKADMMADASQMAEQAKKPNEGFTGWKEIEGKLVYFKDGVISEPPKGKTEEPEMMKESWMDKKLSNFVNALEQNIDKKLGAFEHKNKLQESQSYLFAAVRDSGLPEKAQAKLVRIFKGRVVESAIIDREIEDMRDITAANDISGDLRISGQSRSVRVTESGWDKLTTALDGFWANEDLKGPNGSKIRRMRSLQEAFEQMGGKKYQLRTFMRESVGLPGDRYDSAGRYGVQAGRMTESLTTSSWAQILGDSITRRMLAEYNVPSLQEWRQIVSEIGNIKDFRTQRRMRIGGYGLLPNVGENDSYAPLTSPTDEEATYAINKKGGTEVITLEMMANDDVGAMRRIPLRLGRAAAQTLYRVVFDLIKDNSALAFTDDTTDLFTAAHANIGATSLNPDSLEAALIRMKRQAAYNNSTEPLGLVPRFLLHPPDLRRTVDKLIKSERGEPFTTDNDHNPFLQLNLQPIEIYYWTDTNNWYLVANPSDIPTIEVGFFEGNEDPEIFVSDQENISNSSMFSADKITYKIRHIYGVGVLEYRGFDGNLVS